MLFLLTALAGAEIPPPSFEEALARQAQVEVGTLLDNGDPEQALLRANTFQEEVVESAGLRYLAGISQLKLGRAAPAERELRRATALDPSFLAAWRELGTLASEAGRTDDAVVAWTHVAELSATGPDATLGPLRLAELAAHRQDVESFEAHLRQAIRRGFKFSQVVSDPQWRQFYGDPVMRDSIDKMVTVYGDRAALLLFASPP